MSKSRRSPSKGKSSPQKRHGGPRQSPKPTTPKERVFVEGKIETFAPGGYGVLHDDDGIVFVSGACLNEVVRAEIVRSQKKVRFAQVSEVLEEAGTRQASDCTLHPRCGGCPFLEHTDASESQAKMQMVNDALRRIGRLDEEALSKVEALRSPEQRAGGRRRATLTMSRDGLPGFLGSRSREVVPANSCVALDKDLDETLQGLYRLGRWPPGMRLQIATDGNGGRSAHVLGKHPKAGVLRRLVSERIVHGASGPSQRPVGNHQLKGVMASTAEGGPYLHDASTFSQSTEMGGRLIAEYVIEAMKELGAQEGETVTELFAGAGHITLPLAEMGLKVTAVENHNSALRYLEKNKALSPYGKRIRIVDQFVEARGPTDELSGRRTDWFVADPPRSGIPGLDAWLNVIKPKGLVLVSCDVATGAYSLRVAKEMGYSLKWLRPIDAFPRTAHIEWVALLTRDD